MQRQKPTDTTYAPFTGSAVGKLVPTPTTAQANTGYVLTGAGWQEGTKYNSDNDHTYSFSNGNPTLAWGTKSTVGTAGGVAFTVTMPANPNSNTTYSFTNKAPTLAWGATSTIGVIGGGASANFTVKMPANPYVAPINMRGATTAAAGVAGYVPAPAKGDANRYLRSDGTWQVPPNQTYTFSNKGPTLAWNTVSTIATVGGVNLTVKLPANPNTWPGAATSSALGLIKVNAGTAAANTTNCPANCIYFKY